MTCDVAARQVHVARARRAGPVDADRRTVERHGDPFGVDGERRHADRRQHPAPVGVGSEHRGLDQAVAGDCPGGAAPRRPRIAAPVTVTVTRLVTPSASACSCSAQVVADPQHGVVELGLRRGDLAGTGGQQQHGVVGGTAAVDVEPVEGARGGAAQRLVERCGVGDRVGGQHTQHGGQRRRQHARALGHAADRPVVLGWCSATCLGTVSVVMMAWAASSPPVSPPAISCTISRDAGQHLVHRQPVADQTGGADGDLDGPGLGSPVRQRGGDGLGGGVGVLEAARSGAGVGAAGVEDHRAQPAGGQHLLGPQHRRGLDLVAGEHPGGGVVGSLVEHQREVASARIS